jgi:hypothetical protein
LSQNNKLSNCILKNILAQNADEQQVTPSKINCAKKLIINDNETYVKNSYGDIASMSILLKNNNKGTRVCLQSDSEGRFFRLFLMLQCNIGLLPGLLPVLKVDGTFMKHHTYNGCCLVAIAKTADKSNVPLAIAFVPYENTDTFSWFSMNLKFGGVIMEHYAVFCDRGKQLSAQRRLKKFDLDWLHIKNCTLHIAKNVCARLSPNDLVLHNLIFKLQSTKSLAEYIKTIIKITDDYKKVPSNVTTINDATKNSTMLYIMDIHPTQWSVMGNLNLSTEEKQMIKFIWGFNSHGSKKPLFGVKTSNGVEGENNSCNLNKLRYQPLINGLITFVTRCTAIRNKLI